MILAVAAGNDWSKISTGDLITLNELFELAVENEDGMYTSS